PIAAAGQSAAARNGNRATAGGNDGAVPMRRPRRLFLFRERIGGAEWRRAGFRLPIGHRIGRGAALLLVLVGFRFLLFLAASHLSFRHGIPPDGYVDWIILAQVPGPARERRPFRRPALPADRPASPPSRW